MHVHGEPDGKPCLSFFMIRVVSGMARGRCLRRRRRRRCHTSYPGPLLVTKRKFFFFRVLSVAPCGFTGASRTGIFSHQLQHYRKHVECAFEKIFYLTSSSVLEASIAKLEANYLFSFVQTCAHYFF